VHEPVKAGRCETCHNPHASSADNLLKREEAPLCLSCHKITPEFSANHRGFDPASATCSACHDPHASAEAGLIMKNKHAPFAEGDCNACHVATKAGLPLRGTPYQICNDCHAEQVTSVKKYSAHGATDQESCNLCHKPHAAHDRSLLKQPPVQLCSKCHDPARGEKSEGENPHAKFACANCHAPHGSDQEAYLKQPNLELCATCHSREHHVAHPMGEKVIDPITKTPVTCLSCHDLHAWKSEPLLPALSVGDLCIRCHRDK
jgi:predicted CXXCH cytochrome family protein